MQRMSAAEQLRLFFALRPDRAARAALHRLAQEVAHRGQGRAPAETNLHVTVAFVGKAAESDVATLSAIGQRIAQAILPFDVVLDRIGGTSYGIAWLAPDRASEALGELHHVLADALRAQGFAVERRMFRPHVTLARDCIRAAHRGQVAPIRWRAERLTLESSTLAPGGSQYRTLASWPFADAQGTR
jgi:2'-5' RNA ligase